YNVARAGIHFQNNSESTLRVQNCKLHNCVANDSHVGITYGCVATSNADVIVEAINTLGFAQLDSDTARAPAFSPSPSSEFAETSGNNATDDDSHPGEDGHLVGSGADLLEQALGLENDDLHLKQTFSIQPPYNGGRVLPDFDVDIDGEARGATWSIGADQVQF